MDETADTTGSPIRRVRVDHDLWQAYGETVGMRRRSTDLKRYIEWRVNNPDVKLPGTKAPARVIQRRKHSAGS
jgi:hypothetical protein